MKHWLKNVTAVVICIVLAAGGIPSLSGAQASSAADTGAAAGTTAAAAEEYTAPTNLPAMYINLDDGVQQSEIDKDTYRTAAISLVGADGYDDIIDAAGSIKGRGNYSWSAEKKPYNIKFESKTNVLGMGKAKKWVLIANYWDKTMLRNYITLKMASDVGLAYTPEVRFIDLYVNGVYCGNYLLTEKIEIGKERVNIDDENGGVLFEIEAAYRHEDHTYCHETASGVHFTYKEPEYEDDNEGTVFNTAFIQNMMNTMNPILDEIDASLSQGYSAYSQYIDVDSFVNWYIVNEFCKNYDSQFVTSCYCYYDPADGLLHMGPVWDYDTCYGNQSASGYGVPEGYLISTGSPWYQMLTADSDFMDLVKSRWTELKADGTIYQVLQNTLDGASEIAESEVLNNQAWPNQLLTEGPRGDGTQTYHTYQQELDYLKRFIAERTIWLDEQWNTDPDSTVNKLDNINMIANGLLMDNSMAVDSSYFDTAYALYTSLTPEEAAGLSDEVTQMFDDYEVYAVESAITNAAEVTTYTQKSVVVNARALYDALPEEKKALVTNYNDLLTAEQTILKLAADLGIANVSKNEVTDLVDLTTLTGKAGYGSETYDKLFDGTTSTKYCTDLKSDPYVQWAMTSATEIDVYALATANDYPNRNPKTWVLEGSNDGRNWNTVDTVTDAALSEEPYTYQEFFCDSPGAYVYYRLTFSAVAGDDGNLQFSELLLGSEQDPAVVNVIDAIDALGTVTDLSLQPAVESARALYDALSDSDKICVSNYSKLISAEVAIINLSSDMTAINQVIGLIDAIPADLSLTDESSVTAARAGYDALSEAQQTFVTNYAVLTTAEAQMAVLRADAADQSAAKAVDDLITAIGEVTSADKTEQVQNARAAYNALTERQKQYVTMLSALKSAERALDTLNAVPNTIAAIAAISGTVTHSDGPAVHQARALYDALSADQQAQVTNYAALTAAEAVLQALYDAFDVEVHLSSEGKGIFSNTPWLNISRLSTVQQTSTTDAMADEIWYQYYANGYQMGLTDGYYEISNHNGYFIVQSDVHYFDGTITETDNVGNPWGTENRYWSCVIAPFAGMAFSVNGYMSAATYGYQMPLSDSFEYNGSIYQVYSTGVRYYVDTALVKDTSPAFATLEIYPGSGDDQNHNTFIYAYANYAQKNKWAGKVLGIPYGNVAYTADNSVEYQRFYSEDGDAYIAASAEAVAAADADSGEPTGAYTITDNMLTAFLTLGSDDESRFAVTGAPTADCVSADGYSYQTFENGVLIVTADGSVVFKSESEFQNDVSAAQTVGQGIVQLPELSQMDQSDFDAARYLKTAYDALSDFQKSLIAGDLVEKLTVALTWVEPENPGYMLGDVDGDGQVTVSDVVELRDVIMKDTVTASQLKAADFDNSGSLTVSDVVDLRDYIMKGVTPVVW